MRVLPHCRGRRARLLHRPFTAKRTTPSPSGRDATSLLPHRDSDRPINNVVVGGLIVASSTADIDERCTQTATLLLSISVPSDDGGRESALYELEIPASLVHPLELDLHPGASVVVSCELTQSGGIWATSLVTGAFS